MHGNVTAIIKNSYGFIHDDSGNKYFFYNSDLKNCTIFQLEEGDVVEFDSEKGKRGPIAVHIRKVYQASKGRIYTPGKHGDVKLDCLNQDEKNIVEFLATIFYISSGAKEISIGESTYKYCIIKPTEYYSYTFQFNREIVVIFSDYVTFEPRSLDAAAYVAKQIPSKLRLDRGCHVLICHDSSIEIKLNELLRDNNLNQAVIPFSYAELLNRPNEDLVRNRFRKYLFDTDLFSMIVPIQNDVFFFGRRDFAHDIASKCKNNSHSGVFGLRRSGKTSLLYAVRNILAQQSYPTVFIPCESDLSTLDWRVALCKVVLNVYQALQQDNSQISESDYRTQNTSIYFEEDMNAALSNQQLPVTIMFDEIEAITFHVNQGEKSKNLWYNGDNFVNFWNVIKGYYSKYPTKLSILVAGTNPMINEVPIISERPNPMYRQLSESNQGAYLQAFTNEDTKNMVNTLGSYMGLQFDDYSISKLTSDCGGHPYLMRLLCSHINKFIRSKSIARPCVITKAIYDKAVPEFEKSSEAMGFFSMILNILITSYPQEYDILKVLALNGDQILSQVQSQDGLSHLVGYGIVECNNNNFAIKYETITRFLRGEYAFEKQGLSIEEQKEEIQLRINKAELQLRELVRNTLKTSYGKDEAKKRVVEAMCRHHSITRNDVQKANSLTYQQLFDPSINKMYFSLLQLIIVDNLQCFSNIFEGYSEDDIITNLNAINEARKCPDHCYTDNSENWSWLKFSEFRAGISWLEDVLKEYFD